MAPPIYDDPALGSGNEALGDELNDFVKEAIDEANEDAIKDAIKETLEKDGFESTPEIVQKGNDTLTRKETVFRETQTTEETSIEMQKTGGSMPRTPNIHVKNATSHDKEFLGPKGPVAPISQRERLEAQKDGLQIFIEKETKTLEEKMRRQQEFGTYFPDAERFSHENKIQRAKDKIEQLETEAQQLTEPKTVDIESEPEWKRDHLQAELRNKQAALERIRDTTAEGIEMNNKWGMDALGELTNEHDKLIQEAAE